MAFCAAPALLQLLLLCFTWPSFVQATRLPSSSEVPCAFQHLDSSFQVKKSAEANKKTPPPLASSGAAWEKKGPAYGSKFFASTSPAVVVKPASSPLLRVGTRWSPLALAQTRLLIKELALAQPGIFPAAADIFSGEEVWGCDGNAADPPLPALLRAPVGQLSQTARSLLQKREALRFGEFEIVPFQSAGDALQLKSVEEQRLLLMNEEGGGKGLFTKELETALQSGAVDLAVHSLKDLPAELPKDSVLAAVLPREDPRDVLVLPDEASCRTASASDEASAAAAAAKQVSLRALEAALTGVAAAAAESLAAESLQKNPPSLRFGSASLRRQALVAALVREKAASLSVEFKTLRGNVQTRMRKVCEGSGADATLLAAAGLKRLRLVRGDAPIREAGFPASLKLRFLNPEVFTPAVGQGVVAAECAESNCRVRSLLESIHHFPTALAAAAERAFLAGLDGSCRTPVGGHAIPLPSPRRGLRFSGFVAAPDGSVLKRVEAEEEAVNSLVEAESLGRRAAETLRKEVGESFLENVKRHVLDGWAALKSA